MVGTNKRGVGDSRISHWIQFSPSRRPQHSDLPRNTDSISGYGLAHHVPPRHMTSDLYDHSDSHYFRDNHHGNQFTPYRLQQRSFHRRTQNQQPSQHRPQYPSYMNTGIDQEHDRSSTNLTGAEHILELLRTKREARLKLRDHPTAGAPSHDPQGLHSESVTIKSKPTVPRPNQVDCSDLPSPQEPSTCGWEAIKCVVK